MQDSITSMSPMPLIDRTSTTPLQGPPPQPPVTTSPQPPTALPPQDVAQAQSGPKVSGAVATGLGHLDPLTPDKLKAFFQSRGNEAATAVSHAGDHLVIRVSSGTVVVSHATVEAALRKGEIDGESALARSLFVSELAANVGLPAHAQRAVQTAFAKAVADGAKPYKAMLDAQLNVVLATEVERYVQDKQGLATDMRHIGQFSATAQSGGSDWINSLSLKDKSRNKQIKQTQTELNSALHTFTDAIGTAHESGDYIQAYDALQTFFMTSSRASHDPYWAKRLETQAAAMSMAEVEAKRKSARPHHGSLMQAASEGGGSGKSFEAVTHKALEKPFADKERDVSGLHPRYKTPMVQKWLIRGEMIDVHHKMWQGRSGEDCDYSPYFTQYLSQSQSTAHAVQGTVIKNDGTGRRNAVLKAAVFQTGSHTDGKLGQRNAIFVMGTDNRFYVGDIDKHKEVTAIVKPDTGRNVELHLHHSSLQAGRDVKGAGEIHTNEHGIVKRVTNQSGHYKPGATESGQVFDGLQRLGVDLSNVAYKHFSAEGEVEGMATEFQQGGKTGAERAERFAQRHALAQDVTELRKRIEGLRLLDQMRKDLPAEHDDQPLDVRKQQIAAVLQQWQDVGRGITLNAGQQKLFIQIALAEMPASPRGLLDLKSEKGIATALSQLRNDLYETFDAQPPSMQQAAIDSALDRMAKRGLIRTDRERQLLLDRIAKGELPPAPPADDEDDDLPTIPTDKTHEPTAGETQAPPTTVNTPHPVDDTFDPTSVFDDVPPPVDAWLESDDYDTNILGALMAQSEKDAFDPTTVFD